MSKTITLAEFKELQNSGKTIIIDFSAGWCPPCKVMSPIFEELSQDSSLSDVEFYEVDVDENPELTAEFGITSIPTFPIIKFPTEGEYKILEKFVGVVEKNTFKDRILSLIGSNTKAE